ncbi:hypothetical protein BDEG_20121 [Batrachochytrium dendrobatidis JEL423]|uniref:RRM domain-containing protein n=1 Tax=Batrachochytrium dendrobatidis (strain JEL423) TaxID=403673 RepID=A0A177W848_BATDL|nr:hypothetical protein BDEG_20121 [Batrachochytrium dendrobatidis JEL423]
MSRVVFETQIIDIFREVGTVVSFRLVFDRETSKPKGYGFCTFQDHETAASAVRNLNNYEISGRPLRVNFADADKEAGPDGQPINWSEEDARRGVSSPAPGVGATPRVLQGVNSTEAVLQAVGSFQASQLTELLGHLKLMIQTNPEQCRTLLIRNPQLAYAVFQALISLNAVDQPTMQKILQTQSAPPVVPVVAATPMIQPMAQTPAVAPAGAPSQAHLANLIEEQQKQLLLQVLNLTPEQISALPSDQQQQILALRAQVLGVQ